MSDKTLAELRDQVVQATGEVVWRQWKALGAGAAAKQEATSIVDPEALVYMSLSLLPYELRLADLLADWMAQNSTLLSVQRIKNLARDFPEKVRGRLPQVARIASEEAKDARWGALVEADAPALTERPRKGRAVRRHFTQPSALMLHLRLGMGVGTKADVLAYLLGTQGAWASVAVIAAATGYTPAAVRRTVDDMAAGRFIRSMESLDPTDPAQTVYLTKPVAWAEVLDSAAQLPPWRSWKERFAFVADLLDWEVQTRGRTISPYALGVRGRELMKRHWAAFRRDQAVELPPQARAEVGPEDFITATERLAEWMVANA